MLWVLFDPRCETKHNGTLSFYHGSDERCRRTPIAQFTGTNFMPFVVPGNKVQMQFIVRKKLRKNGFYDRPGLHKSISKKAMKSEKRMSKQGISEEFGTVPTGRSVVSCIRKYASYTCYSSW